MPYFVCIQTTASTTKLSSSQLSSERFLRLRLFKRYDHKLFTHSQTHVLTMFTDLFMSAIFLRTNIVISTCVLGRNQSARKVCVQILFRKKMSVNGRLFATRDSTLPTSVTVNCPFQPFTTRKKWIFENCAHVSCVLPNFSQAVATEFHGISTLDRKIPKF